MRKDSGFTLKLKIKARKLKQELTAVYYAYKDPRVKWLPRIIILLTLGYALSPIDLIPDFIPILGYLDDLILLPALIMLAIKLIPKDVWGESKSKALDKPLILKKNWAFAVFIILIWIVLIGSVVKALL